MLSQRRLRALLAYDPETGEWVWNTCPPPNSRRSGQVAGYVRSDRYKLIRVDNERYYASRLAWFYMTGFWPTEEIDHEDRNPANDRWENLREATSSDNKCNTKTSSRNTSGYRGIGWLPLQGKWQVHVNSLYCGCFDDLEEAILTRDEMAARLQGPFASLILERVA